MKLIRTQGLVTFGLEVQAVRAQAHRDSQGPGLVGVPMLMRQPVERQDAKRRRDLAILRLPYDLEPRRGEAVRVDTEDVYLEGDGSG